MMSLPSRRYLDSATRLLAIPLMLILAVNAVPAIAAGSDIDNSGKVDIGDLVTLITDWKKTGSPGWIASDINTDGIVNILDLVILITDWGKTLAPSASPTPAPPGASLLRAPTFGDSAADTLIWYETWEAYNTTDDIKTSNGGPWSTSVTTGNSYELVAGRGIEGGKAMMLRKDSPPSGVTISRGGLTSPDHFFAEFWFKLDTLGYADPEPRGKWVIMRTDNEGTSPAGVCDGGSIGRFEFPLARGPVGAKGPNSRFQSRGDWNEPCVGPVAGAPVGYFLWDTRAGADPRYGAPVLPTDPDIGVVPWNPINDGNWHRQTFEWKVGPDGYWRHWLDGYLYWDNSSSPMQIAGHPTLWQHVLVAEPADQTPYHVTLDNLRMWKR